MYIAPLSPCLHPDKAAAHYPGDDVIPSANMIYDQYITIPDSTPAEVSPWLAQLGAGRAG